MQCIPRLRVFPLVLACNLWPGRRQPAREPPPATLRSERRRGGTFPLFPALRRRGLPGGPPSGSRPGGRSGCWNRRRVHLEDDAVLDVAEPLPIEAANHVVIGIAPEQAVHAGSWPLAENVGELPGRGSSASPIENPKSSSPRPQLAEPSHVVDDQEDRRRVLAADCSRRRASPSISAIAAAASEDWPR